MIEILPLFSRFVSNQNLKISLGFLDCVVISLFFLVLCYIFKLIGVIYTSLRAFLIDDSHKDYSEPGMEKLETGPFPNFWIPVAEKEQLAIGRVLRVRTLGREIVLLRDTGGIVHAIDPYCPHNGAHLGYGDVVNVQGEDCIRCPFHEWSFRAKDGVCVDVPYARDKMAPKGSRIKKWHCIEVRDIIFIWYHDQGCQPSYFLDLVPEIDHGKFELHGRAEITLNSDVYSVNEGTADTTHLAPVHKDVAPLGVLSKIPGFPKHLLQQMYINPIWKPRAHPNYHTAESTSTNHLEVLGLTSFKVNSQTTLHGPTCWAIVLEFGWIYFTAIREVSILVMPIESNKLRLVTRCHGPKNLFSRFLTRFLLFGIQFALMDDIKIWQPMIRLKKPMYQKEEKFLVLHHRWYNQFLSKESESATSELNNIFLKSDSLN